MKIKTGLAIHNYHVNMLICYYQEFLINPSLERGDVFSMPTRFQAGFFCLTMRERERSQTIQEVLKIEGTIVLEDDLIQRFRVLSRALELSTFESDAEDWLLEQSDKLQRLLGLYTNGTPVLRIEQEVFADELEITRQQ